MSRRLEVAEDCELSDDAARYESLRWSFIEKRVHSSIRAVEASRQTRDYAQTRNSIAFPAREAYHSRLEGPR